MGCQLFRLCKLRLNKIFIGLCSTFLLPPPQLRWRIRRHVQVEAKSIKAFSASARRLEGILVFWGPTNTITKSSLQNSHFFLGGGRRDDSKKFGAPHSMWFFFWGLSLGKILPSEPPSASSSWLISGLVITVPPPTPRQKKNLIRGFYPNNHWSLSPNLGLSK